MASQAASLFRVTAVTTAWFLLLAEHVFDVTVAYGPSMQPTLKPRGTVLITSHMRSSLASLTVGDVVVFKSPGDRSLRMCKRLIGLPGDVVVVDPTVSDDMIKVPKGHVWLAGDNMANSTDSRTFGPVPMGLLVGKVVYKILPLGEAGPVHGAALHDI